MTSALDKSFWKRDESFYNKNVAYRTSRLTSVGILRAAIFSIVFVFDTSTNQPLLFPMGLSLCNFNKYAELV